MVFRIYRNVNDKPSVLDVIREEKDYFPQLKSFTQFFSNSDPMNLFKVAISFAFKSGIRVKIDDKTFKIMFTVKEDERKTEVSVEILKVS